MTVSARRLLVLLLGVACLAFAACGDDDSSDDSGSATTTESAPATTESTPTETTPAQTDTAGGGGAEKIDVAAAEPGTPTPFAFDPKELDAKAGKVTFTLDNPSGNQAPHALEIEGEGIEEETEVIQPGDKASVEVDLKPGKYVFYCPVGDHRQEGMEGTLTVQ